MSILEPPVKSLLPELVMAIDAAQKAGQAILNVYSTDFSAKTKDDDSPITEADLKSNEIIKKILSKTGHFILSEEEDDDMSRLQERKIWVVDPLDGTLDFVNKTGEFTVMIAFVEDGKPILGVIYWPTQNTMFVAQKGSGAFKFDDDTWNKISVSNVSDLGEAVAVGSRHHLSDEEKRFLEKLGIRKFSGIGSSLKVGMISAGEADAYITTTNKMKEWDSCASCCIIHEAGGKMTDMLGNEMIYNNEDVGHQNGLLVTNGRIHQKILDAFKD